MEETQKERRRRRDREAKRRRYYADPDAARAKANKYAAKDRAPARLRAAAWRKANPERARQLAQVSRLKRKERWTEFLAQERARYRKDPDKKLAKQKLTRADPAIAAKQKDYQREYAKLRPELFAMRCAIRRATKLKATPPWCDLAAVAEIYRQARQLTVETGIKHEVDHIIPLRGKGVCGLHIPQNMQILTCTENRRKHNHADAHPDSHSAASPHQGASSGL